MIMMGDELLFVAQVKIFDEGNGYHMFRYESASEMELTELADLLKEARDCLLKNIAEKAHEERKCRLRLVK